jgi:hypothetical protein
VQFKVSLQISDQKLRGTVDGLYFFGFNQNADVELDEPVVSG